MIEHPIMLVLSKRSPALPYSSNNQSGFHAAHPQFHLYTGLGSQTVASSVLLPEEVPVAFVYNGISQAVMMASPFDLEDFALGYSIGSGLIKDASCIYGIEITQGIAGIELQISVSQRAFANIKQLRRTQAGSTGCGLCGVESLANVLPDLASHPPQALPPAQHLSKLRSRLASHQLLAKQTGALHAALYVDEDGDIKLCREDVGRHNAMDKLIGALLNDQCFPERGFVVVTSRCSLELIQKAVRAGFSTLATLSAPTNISVSWARHCQLNLVHIPRSSDPRVYSPEPL
ncbi:MAG TPA: formate dehydrogenase accessory sulfurtransferase FdhD [Pseudomonas sabulinigri]|nr:formate dehydrogenase accessory sulfurtransferase FdhD [Halopseudomonas sabulinigri]HEC51240.1 formate dehydrogenase accessory sulfurtransferase FdhD [Halopseudomonas sabulinigri]